MKTGEVAHRLGVSENTIRNWTREFADHLSAGGAGGDGSVREITDQDARVLATIQRETRRGLPYDKIRKVLKKGALIEALPPMPENDPERVKDGIVLVPKQDADIEILRTQLNGLAAQLNQAMRERDSAVEKVDALYERIAELERQAGRVPDLEQRIAELKEQLERKRRGLFG